MKIHELAIAAFSVLSLVACGKGEAEAPPPTAAVKVAEAATKPAARSATAGSIDFAIQAETISANSKGDADGRQCQLAFVATNNSAVDVSSMVIEFDALAVSGGAPAGGKLNLTMPMLVKAGASQEAWGNITVDNFACDALQLSFPPQAGFMCRTSSKVPCAPYRFNANGIAITG